VGDHGSVQHHPISKLNSVVGTAISFPFGPGLMVVLFPWLITHWQHGAPYPRAVRALGAVLIALGAILTVATFVRFASEGTGIPFPTDPPSSQRVMVGGPYRYVRNPMYVSFMLVIVGEALLLSRPVLLIYAAAVLIFLVAFVRFWEERTMASRFGAEYEAYRQQVPGWLPRLPRRTA
jgi:protein-S-isoprenylcysteine O-methyltransferase Ste14